MSFPCPNCQHENFEGALFCSECGTKLVDEDGLSTAAIRATDARIDAGNSQKVANPAPPVITGDAVISLHLVRTGQILPLVGRTEYTIGRISEGQSILPDIDLTPYDAYSQGVSRLHATIKVKDENIMLIDLGSSNGTRMNDKKLRPHEEHNLAHGDMISLGRFKIQALLRQEENVE